MPTAQAAQLGCPAACFAAPSEDQGLRRPARQTPDSLSYFVFNVLVKRSRVLLVSKANTWQFVLILSEVKSVEEPGFW